MEFKKYTDIERLKEKYAMAFKPGEMITVSEKLDGSNASFDGNLNAFSRRKVLDETNTLNGFYDFVKTLDATKVMEVLGENFIVFGEWLCLSGDTVIKKASSGKARNTMTLREMYQQKYTLRRDTGCKRGIKKLLNLLYKEKAEITEQNYNKTFGLDKETTIKEALNKNFIIEENGKYIITQDGIDYIMNYYFQNSTWGKDGFPSIFSLNLETDSIQTNRVADIVYTGDKEVYELTTHKGYKIKTTREHKFLTPYGWKPLSELRELDCVAITDFISRTNHGRVYGKGARSIIKAQEEYKKKIGKCEKCGSIAGLELHHIDENYKNNSEDNWMVLCRDCHKNIHIKTNNQPNYDYEFDYIVNIEYKGIEDCYDIAMEGGEDLANFIANNFIVHNCKHTVKYPEDKMHKFYAFDVWNKGTAQYLPWSEAKKIIAELGLNTVPIFYEGPFTSWDDINKLVGQTKMGASPCGEGQVVKSQDRLDNKSSNTPAYVKIVDARFSEVKGQKEQKMVDPEVIAAKHAQEALAATIVTERRVEKLIQKIIEDGLVPTEWDEKDLGTIAKHLPKAVYADCVKEEPETVAQIENFGKIAASIAMKLARRLVK